MKVSNRTVQFEVTFRTGWTRSAVAGVLALLMVTPFDQAWAATLQQASAGQQPAIQRASVQLPDAPNAPQAVTVAAQQQGPNQQSAQQSAQQPGQSTQQQNGNQQPVGTAAAPLPKSGGVAASRPAGAVIAPGKQKRARAILIRVGIVVAAAVAVGTVVGLSKASPSRPN